jgi:hypothetical protein
MVAGNPLSLLRKQRAALDRAIRALEQFQQLNSNAHRARQREAASPKRGTLLSMDAASPPARKVADQ